MHQRTEFWGPSNCQWKDCWNGLRILGEDVLDLNKSFDSDMPAMIIYHSHPNGKAYLSETDRQVATSPWGDGPAYPVQQLVIGIDDHQIVSSAQFAWSEHENEFVEINQYSGAAI